MDMENILVSYERWLHGNQLTTNEITFIILSIILCVMLLALLLYVSIHTLFWTRIRWTFEDLWHWFKKLPL